MACYHPLLACVSTSPHGDRAVKVLHAYQGHMPDPVVFPDGGTYEFVLLPCGQCLYCRLRHSLEWTVRCYHEFQSCGSVGSFVTLTFDDDHVPRLTGGTPTLAYRPFQLFNKRLRQAFPDQRIRFLMCGEYGDNTRRPHYHVLYFGFQFPDAKPFHGNYFRSDSLERLWTDGYSLIAPVVPKSINYVCRYNLKKVIGRGSEGWYKGRMPEFIRMSNRPGVGARWLERYECDVYRFDSLTEQVFRDAVRYNGHECRPPRYYDKAMSEKYGQLWDIVLDARRADANDRDLPTLDDLHRAELVAQYNARQHLISKRLSRRTPHV